MRNGRKGTRPSNKGGKPRGKDAKLARGKFADGEHTYERDSKASGANDIRWWNHNPELTNSAGNLSFNNPLGSRVYLNDSTTGLVLPGICELEFVPTMGVASDLTDPVNVAANNIYTWVRHMNSGARNYEAPDLMMWLVAMDSLYMYHAWMCRIYGVLNTYSITNRYIPLALAKALGVDVSDVKGKMASLLYYINNFAVRIGSLAVPDSFDYYKRHRFMVSNVYADAGNDKAQLYFYNPSAILQYSPLSEETGTSLTYISMPNNATVDRIITFGEALLAPIINDEDVGIMSGDCLKAFGRESIIQLPMIQPDYAVGPTYNVEILGQIHNSIITDGIDFDNTKIVQNNGVVISDIILNSDTPQDNISTTWLLNSYDDNPSAEQVMEFTRNMMFSQVWEDTSNNVYRSQVITCGTEIISGVTVYNLAAGSLNSLYTVRGSQFTISSTSVFSGNIPAGMISYLTAFDWFPLLYYVGGAWSPVTPGAGAKVPTPPAIAGIFGDIRNYTVITPDVLRKLHETALLSAFSVEQVGRQTI